MIGLRAASKVDYVFSEDPAIDKDHPAYDWSRFLETGDVAHVPAKQGEELTVFRLRRLPLKAFEYVMARDNGFRQIVEAVAFGVADIRNFKTASGDTLQLKRKKTDFGIERLTDETLDHLAAPMLLAELGNRILGLSQLTP